jgi:hypothetical protein
MVYAITVSNAGYMLDVTTMAHKLLAALLSIIILLSFIEFYITDTEIVSGLHDVR